MKAKYKKYAASVTTTCSISMLNPTAHAYNAGTADSRYRRVP